MYLLTEDRNKLVNLEQITFLAVTESQSKGVWKLEAIKMKENRKHGIELATFFSKEDAQFALGRLAVKIDTGMRNRINCMFIGDIT